MMIFSKKRIVRIIIIIRRNSRHSHITETSVKYLIRGLHLWCCEREAIYQVLWADFCVADLTVLWCFEKELLEMKQFCMASKVLHMRELSKYGNIYYDEFLLYLQFKNGTVKLGWLEIKNPVTKIDPSFGWWSNMFKGVDQLSAKRKLFFITMMDSCGATDTRNRHWNPIVLRSKWIFIITN